MLIVTEAKVAGREAEREAPPLLRGEQTAARHRYGDAAEQLADGFDPVGGHGQPQRGIERTDECIGEEQRCRACLLGSRGDELEALLDTPA